jgi:phosphoribosylaminoimidazole-succinocarboxamide synthase
MKYFTNISSPQLNKIHTGKVRDSFRISNTERMIVVTDRISAFDNVLKTPIQYKGAVLNGIANFWFDKTSNIIENHFIRQIDPNITLVRELVPIRVEMVVRGYLTGSMWRYYQEGKRKFSGITVSDGLQKNQKFIEPILTPTTKEDVDREISPEEIISSGLCKKEVYHQIADTALALYNFGAQYLLERGIILVDTKYEFGLLDGKVILMDEIHTPDSSRFWRKVDYEKNPGTAEQIDKEFVRQWLIKNKINGEYPTSLPEDVAAETGKRYLEIFRLVTGSKLVVEADENVTQRMYQNLLKQNIIKDGYVAIVMGSPKDVPHAQKVNEYLVKFGIMTEYRVVSAHKNGEEILNLAKEYNNSIEPGAVIAIAGRSNGLGGALAANLNIPVINCPPFKDNLDMLMNINSSLMMPSQTPAVTAVQPDNAAYAALRSLNIPRLRKIFSEMIAEQKEVLREEDKKLRGR